MYNCYKRVKIKLLSNSTLLFYFIKTLSKRKKYLRASFNCSAFLETYQLILQKLSG